MRYFLNKQKIAEILDSNPNEGKLFYSKTLDTVIRIYIHDYDYILSESIYGKDIVGDVNLYFKNLDLVGIGNV